MSCCRIPIACLIVRRGWLPWFVLLRASHESFKYHDTSHSANVSRLDALFPKTIHNVVIALFHVEFFWDSSGVLSTSSIWCLAREWDNLPLKSNSSSKCVSLIFTEINEYDRRFARCSPVKSFSCSCLIINPFPVWED